METYKIIWKQNLNSTLVIFFKFAFIEKLDKLITHKMCWYKSDQACSCEPVSLQVMIATGGDAVTSRDR
jgi:hypothetical protein